MCQSNTRYHRAQQKDAKTKYQLQSVTVKLCRSHPLLFSLSLAIIMRIYSMRVMQGAVARGWFVLCSEGKAVSALKTMRLNETEIFIDSASLCCEAKVA